MKNIKTIISAIIFLCLFLSIFNVNANPTIENITTNPVKPKPLSTFTVIASITGENIISLNVTISECTEQPPAQCFKSHPNIPMTLNDNGKYEAEVTLTGTQDSIDHVQYLFIINDNGNEYQIGDMKTYLDIETNNNGSDNGSPGFELIILLIAMFISLIFFKRKR
ncbi:MAG: hypothetical protein A3K77_00320 [Euryarchaeota archaeon RBG_13_31_8]|nr:MAG: hypothetical protein A3K77_00320 [Euryarchaeota archaeon RBG_13_31_8]